MRNSKINHIRNTSSTPFINFNSSQLPKSSEPHIYTPKSYTNKNEIFESNYNYFFKRMEPEKNTSLHNTIKGGHQRYASMGSSRVFDKNDQLPFEKVLNCESSPYLFSNKKKETRMLEERGQVTPVCEAQSYLASRTKNLMKLSMKSIHKNSISSNERISILKESQSSTIGETNTMSVTSKVNEEKISKEELLKYFENNFSSLIKSLKNEINNQNETIENLKFQINNTNNKLKEKENIIQNLTNHIKKHNQYITNSTQENISENINNKIYKIQNQINYLINHQISQQTEKQNEINYNIEKIMQILTKPYAKNNINESIMAFSKNFQKYHHVLQKTIATLNFTSSISKISNNLSKTISQISSACSKTIFNSILEETAQFNQIPQQDSLNDSHSYFFHPSELSNLEKITELFISRQGKPIQCFIDQNNYVKYRDTGTFMYHKNGDFVQLSHKEKMYYIDRGFIVE